MFSSRRVFLGVLFLAGASQVSNLSAQQGAPLPPFPNSRQEPSPEPPHDAKRNKIILKANREAVAKDVARMSDLIDELKKQLQENDTADILSLDVIRKSEEIEKLAKHVKDLVRG